MTTITLRANNYIASEYNTFASKVAGLIAICPFGDASISDELRLSVLNGAGILGKLTSVYPSGIVLNDDGGVTLTPAGTGNAAARLVFPYTPENNGETCVTLVSALSMPTFVQICVYAGYRIGINGAGDIEAVSSLDSSKVATSAIGLVNKGYMSPTEALKPFVIVTELRTIIDSGVRLTVSLHDASGSVLTNATSGFSGVVLDISASTPYVGGTKAGATTYKSTKHYGHLIFHRQLTDSEKAIAAAQLAGVANTVGANIA